jgi:hypothetical protein
VPAAGDAARAEPAAREPIRRAGASWREVFRGPFRPSQLFAMPTAHVVGAYQLRLHGDASLLSERDVLSTSSVAALGFGDLAQLEYRQSAAIRDASREVFGLPSLGVQFELPLRERRYVPRIGLALRFGLPRLDGSAGAARRFEERATDLYMVLSADLGRVELHLGSRVTAAALTPTDAPDDDAVVKRTLLLPAAGVNVAVGARSSFLLEAAMVPRFELPSASTAGAIAADPYGRAGVRWVALSWLTIDASVGYHLELERRSERRRGDTDALVDWDIRIGGELAIPWGAVVCRSVAIFCS